MATTTTTTTTILINGNLKEIVLQPETVLDVETACDIQIVNLGAPLLLDAVWKKPKQTANLGSFGLAFGGVALIEVVVGEKKPQQQEEEEDSSSNNNNTTSPPSSSRTIAATERHHHEEEEEEETTTTLTMNTAIALQLTFRVLEPALNLTERQFANEVGELLLKSGPATTTTTTTTAAAAATTDEIGALAISCVAQRCSENNRMPTHGCKMIESLDEIVNSFEGQNGEKLCVGKKRSKPRSFCVCPRIEASTGIDAISRRASRGEAIWRQCAASFSTMMRHFQKSPTTFKWESDAKRRTIITRS